MTIVHTRALLSVALLALLPGTAGVVQAAVACDNCPERRVGLYDFEVTVPRPDSLGDVADWYSLFYAAPGASARISTSGCTRFIDGVFYRDSSGVPSKSLTVGIDRPSTAPAGGMKGMDYLVTGSVSPDGAGFKLTMSLESACDRKKVITASGHFDRADQASTLGADLATQKFIPIAEKIRAFEREARAANTDVSIGGYNAKLVVDPQRRKASLNEKVPVTLTLIDCDGEPLAGRTISFTGNGNKMAPPSNNGAFTVSEATTGSDGKVSVEFQVGTVKGVALARAYFIHKTPFGCEAVAADEAAIEVDGSAAYYQIRYEYEELWAVESLFEEQPTPTWIKTIRRNDSRRTFFIGSAVLRNTAFSAGAGAVELDGAGLDGGLMSGSYAETIRMDAHENYSDPIAVIRRANFEDRRTEGVPLRSDSLRPDFFASLDPADLGESSQFSFGIPFALHGTVTGGGFEVIQASGKTFDSSTSFDEVNSWETRLSPAVKLKTVYTFNDSAFHIHGALDTSWTEKGEDITTTTAKRGKLQVTISPIAVRPKPAGVIARGPDARRQERLRILNNGSLTVLGLQDVAPDIRVHVELYSLGGRLLSVIHDAPRGTRRELTLALDQARSDAGAGLSLVVLRAGPLRASRVLYLNRN